jgi:transglutaminase-like putative cysteine protease
LPDLGWIGFDPTNNTVAAERHIRVAVGRDYADVPPTRGIFRGRADSELAVTVRVLPAEAPSIDTELSLDASWVPVMAEEHEQGDDPLWQQSQQQ